MNNKYNVLFAVFGILINACVPLVGGPGEPCTKNGLCIENHVCDSNTNTCIASSKITPVECPSIAPLASVSPYTGLCESPGDEQCRYYPGDKSNADTLKTSAMCWIDDGDYDVFATKTSVHIANMAIDRFEVTNERYLKYVSSLAQSEKNAAIPQCNGTPQYWSDSEGWFGTSDLPNQFEKHPVVCVNLQQAQNFCTWAGKRLPTRAEWQAAGMGGQYHPYPWGEWDNNNSKNANCYDNQSNCDDDHKCCTDKYNQNTCNDSSNTCTETAPVINIDNGATLPLGASKFGPMHMSGNAAEWVLDDDGTAYTCGGSWDDFAKDIELWNCYPRPSLNSTSQSTIGFRCAWSAD